MAPTASSLRNQKNDSFSLLRFSWLLGQRRFDFVPEQQIHSRIPDYGKHPDFFVETPFGSLLAEVKSFDQPVKGFVLPRGAAQISFQGPIKGMRSAMNEAADQLKPYASLGMPLVVVLDNHRILPVGGGKEPIWIPARVDLLREAVFGQIELRVGLNRATERFEELGMHHGPGQVLNAREKTYISAVVWNVPKRKFVYEDGDSEVPMRVTGILNPYAKVPLPVGTFNDDEDCLYAYDADRRWGRVHGNR
jgi:hypothetical protein